jgi:hypothetical protein
VEGQISANCNNKNRKCYRVPGCATALARDRSRLSPLVFLAVFLACWIQGEGWAGGDGEEGCGGEGGGVD